MLISGEGFRKDCRCLSWEEAFNLEVYCLGAFHLGAFHLEACCLEVYYLGAFHLGACYLEACYREVCYLKVGSGVSYLEVSNLNSATATGAVVVVVDCFDFAKEVSAAVACSELQPSFTSHLF